MSQTEDVSYSKKAQLQKAQNQMRILIGTHHFFTPAGSEIFAYTLAKFLSLKGYDITLYSPYPGGIIFENTQKLGIRVVNDLEQISRENFDIIHVSHNIIAYETRHYFPNIPMVCLSHGVLPFLEQPSLDDLNISIFLATSEEVRNNLISCGISTDKIIIFRNIVDTERFCPINKINPVPQKALILSRRIDSDTLDVIKGACNNLGLEIIRIGNGRGVVWNVEDYINQVDLVFSLGRGILESMSCGRAAVVFDYNGGDGMVTYENIDEIQKCNFSGRRFKKRYGVAELINEIEKYTPEVYELNRKLVLERFDALVNIEYLLNIYKKAMGSFEESEIDSERLTFFVSSIKETRTNFYNLNLQEKQNRIAGIESPINQLQDSLGYRMLLRYRRLKNKLFPLESRRRAVYEWWLKQVKRLI